MARFYERYQQGFYQEVCDELLDLGEEVFTEQFYDDAQLVATVLMQRVQYNISLIVPRLHTLGYRFGEGMWEQEDDMSLEEKLLFEKDMPVFQPPVAETDHILGELEHLIGTLPLSLRAWYKEVGCVNLVGLFHLKDALDFQRTDGASLDPLLIYSVELLLRMISDYKERNVWEKDPTLPLSPDNLFKYGYSGAGPYAIKIPCKAFDAPFLRESHHTTFINYLRVCIHWGGFPGLEQNKKLSKEAFHFLTKDLISF